MTSNLPNLTGLTILLSVLIVVVKSFSEDHRKLIEKRQEGLKKELEFFKKEHKSLGENDPLCLYTDTLDSRYEALSVTEPMGSSGIVRFGYIHLFCFSLCYFLTSFPIYYKYISSIYVPVLSFALLCLVSYSGVVVWKMGREKKKFFLDIGVLDVDCALAKMALERAKKKREDEDSN